MPDLPDKGPVTRAFSRVSEVIWGKLGPDISTCAVCFTQGATWCATASPWIRLHLMMKTNNLLGSRGRFLHTFQSLPTRNNAAGLSAERVSVSRHIYFKIKVHVLSYIQETVWSHDSFLSLGVKCFEYDGWRWCHLCVWKGINVPALCSSPPEYCQRGGVWCTFPPSSAQCLRNTLSIYCIFNTMGTTGYEFTDRKIAAFLSLFVALRLWISAFFSVFCIMLLSFSPQSSVKHDVAVFILVLNYPPTPFATFWPRPVSRFLAWRHPKRHHN